MNTYTVIKNKRLLKNIEKLGFIKEAQYDFYPCCSEGINYNGSFEYRKNKYSLKYFDGCFSPFLVKFN